MEYGCESQITESEKLLNVAISENTFQLSVKQIESIKEDTIESLRERLREESKARVEAEIANKAWELRYEKIRTCLHLSDDPELARQELEIHNSLRLGLVPISSAVSTETHAKQVEYYCKPSILEMAKDITKLGLFYDGIIHIGAMIKQELNKVDTKTKVKLKFEAKVKETEKKRDEPKVKVGRKARSAEESFVIGLLKVPSFRSMKESDLVNVIRQSLPHLTTEKAEQILTQMILETLG